jgi:hypothetical protein
MTATLFGGNDPDAAEMNDSTLKRISVLYQQLWTLSQQIGKRFN